MAGHKSASTQGDAYAYPRRASPPSFRPHSLPRFNLGWYVRYISAVTVITSTSPFASAVNLIIPPSPVPADRCLRVPSTRPPHGLRYSYPHPASTHRRKLPPVKAIQKRIRGALSRRTLGCSISCIVVLYMLIIPYDSLGEDCTHQRSGVGWLRVGTYATNNYPDVFNLIHCQCVHSDLLLTRCDPRGHLLVRHVRRVPNRVPK